MGVFESRQILFKNFIQKTHGTSVKGVHRSTVKSGLNPYDVLTFYVSFGPAPLRSHFAHHCRGKVSDLHARSSFKIGELHGHLHVFNCYGFALGMQGMCIGLLESINHEGLGGLL